VTETEIPGAFGQMAKPTRLNRLLSSLAQGKKRAPSVVSEDAVLFQHAGSCFVKILFLIQVMYYRELNLLRWSH